MEIYGITDQGKTRLMNEDHFYHSDKPVGRLPNLAVIADGMGGHSAGEVASRMAVEVLVENCGQSQEEGVDDILRGGVQAANRQVFRLAKERGYLFGMGTTLAACVVTEGNRLYAVNVGDSRIYIYDGTLRQISLDHSLVEEMVQAGEITREESLVHPDRNKITRAIGTGAFVLCDLYVQTLAAGSVVLLCTDGLTNMVGDGRIQEILGNGGSLEQRVRDLLEEALENGGCDNVTIVAMATSDQEKR
ncbi:Stp1/IreP family PP2C-type Ser/Thr phosphatase [Anaerotalea alkaliphila]|uniref:Stp1/IreP family PP2C-type Ser/Thr phosphatase n=1 Tax=Anaerotalea alkaliphila TaxID=2662126 RepID=A0A7X5KNL8_9FIRM|nr:Stp1/IreP family PP2C-type Ser/Thr phosphatase [Anaerotalea alkaliphila]NDL66887.1 Stp1/IreP family PP2C-type Ser/Thr phosphatase [Anaerotalea alkaliphila]